MRSDAPALAPARAPALDRDVDLDRSGASDRSDGSPAIVGRGRLRCSLPASSRRRKPSLALNLEGVGGGAANDADASVDASEMMVESFAMDESLDESSDRSVTSARSGSARPGGGGESRENRRGARGRRRRRRYPRRERVHRGRWCGLAPGIPRARRRHETTIPRVEERSVGGRSRHRSVRGWRRAFGATGDESGRNRG